MFGIGKVDPNVTEKRNYYVGGSDVPTILGINHFKTSYELAREKTGIDKREFTGNEYTSFGNVLEPQIRKYINLAYERNFVVDTFINNEKLIRSNVDGIDYDTKQILEVKTHGKHFNQKVYELQMQLYMWQTGCQEGWLALYERPQDFDTEFDQDRLEVISIKRDDEEIQKILDAIETFQIRCEFLKDDPEMSEQDFLTYGTDMDKYLLALQEATPQLLAMQEEIKTYEVNIKNLKEKLYDAMTENDIKKLETPRLIVTRVLPNKSKRFDSKTFKQDHADLYEQYQKESERKGYVKLTERKENDD